MLGLGRPGFTTAVSGVPAAAEELGAADFNAAKSWPKCNTDVAMMCFAFVKLAEVDEPDVDFLPEL